MDSIEILKVADLARNSISDFCLNECGAKCCRQGQLLLQNERELQAIVKNKKNHLIKKGVICQTKMGNYTFDYKKFGSPCPNLDENNFCKIYKSLNKPRICGNFPLFVMGDKFILSEDFCPAVKNGLFNDYIVKLEALGLKKL